MLVDIYMNKIHYRSVDVNKNMQRIGCVDVRESQPASCRRGDAPDLAGLKSRRDGIAAVPRSIDGDYFHGFVAEVVDDFDGDAAVFRGIEGA